MGRGATRTPPGNTSLNRDKEWTCCGSPFVVECCLQRCSLRSSVCAVSLPCVLFLVLLVLIDRSVVCSSFGCAPFAVHVLGHVLGKHRLHQKHVHQVGEQRHTTTQSSTAQHSTAPPHHTHAHEDTARGAAQQCVCVRLQRVCALCA